MASVIIRCSKGEICLIEDDKEDGYAMLGAYSFDEVSYTLKADFAEIYLKDLNMIVSVESDEANNWRYSVYRDDWSKNIGASGYIIVEEDPLQGNNLYAVVTHNYSPLRIEVKD